MALVAVGHACVALAYMALAVVLYSGATRRLGGLSRVQQAFMAALVISALWGVLGVSLTALRAPWGQQAYELLDLARYAAWFVFALRILGPEAGVERQNSWRPVALVALAVVAVNVAWVVLGLGAMGWGQNYAPLLSLSLPVMGLVLVEQVSRSVVEDGRWHIKPLVVGLGLPFAFDLYLHSQPLLFGTIDRDALSVRAAVHALPVPMLFIAAKRHADWSNPVQVSRNAVFFTMSITLAGLYLLGMAAVGFYMRHVDDQWGKALALLLMVAALGVLAWLVASPSLRAKARVMLGKNLFRYRFDYRREWLRLTESLAAGSTPQAMGVAIVRGLATMLNSPSGELWTVHGDTAATRLASWRVDDEGAGVTLDRAFVDRLRTQAWIFDLDECRSQPVHPDAAIVPAAWLSNQRCWLIVPLRVGEALLGFVVLGRPHAAIDVNWETRDLLHTAGQQAAAFMALSHATESLVEARKFEAFNRMSAFVVHDLKNVVAQQSLMLQNARRLKDNPAFQADMLTTVENSVERMQRLLTQLREGETPVGVAQGVPLEPLLRGIQTRVQVRGRSINLMVETSVSTRGHGDRIERVLGHLIDNALDATSEAGDVNVVVKREGSQAVVEVRDTGHGMTEDFVKSQLFKPFRTTKAAGMGIGAYESMQYIRELGGSLEVQSVIDQGTVVKVLLPLFHHELGTALNAADPS